MSGEEAAMSELGSKMKVFLADTFVMYMMAHKYHVNVEGRDFYQYHELFGNIYNELWTSVDVIAEQIRALDEYVPFSFERFGELTTISSETRIPTASTMMESLLAANDKVIQSAKAALSEAKIAGDAGVENFLGGRLETHAKHGWMLRATGKTNRE